MDTVSTVAEFIYNDYVCFWRDEIADAESDLSDIERRRAAVALKLVDALRPCLHSLALSRETIAALEAALGEPGRELEIDPAIADWIIHQLKTEPALQHGLALQLGREASGTLLIGAVDRLAVLLELVSTRTVSERAAAYLDRATRLYLWGFEPEAILMCAAVIEAAYEERISDLSMFECQIPKENNKHDFTVPQYERAAVAMKIYSSDDKKRAEALRRARNDVVHAVPAVALSPEDALVTTATLLGKLFPV